MVIEVGSCTEGHGFKSQQCICGKNCIDVCLIKTRNKQKEAGMVHLKTIGKK